MFAALLLCLAADPAALDSLQGTWESVGGTQLAIDGDQITVTGDDGLSGFTGRLVLTPRRLRIVDAGGVAALGLSSFKRNRLLDASRP
jgi:hypothetical protein